MYFNVFSHLLESGLDKFPKCVCVCVWGEGGVRNVRKTYEREGALLKTYESVQGGKGVKNCQIWANVLFERPLSKTFPFTSTLQTCSPEFSTSTKIGSKKNFSCKCSDINGNLTGKC